MTTSVSVEQEWLSEAVRIATRNVENGIGFHLVSGVGIWTFSKLTVPAATTIVFKHAASSAGASILSAGDLTIAGTIDLRGYGDPTQALMATSTSEDGEPAR